MMKRIKKLAAWMWVSFLLWTVASVTVDTYILGGKLKLLWIAIANTTSSSIYSTDGQSNIVIIIVALTGLIIFAYILGKCGVFSSDEDQGMSSEKDKSSDDDSPTLKKNNGATRIEQIDER